MIDTPARPVIVVDVETSALRPNTRTSSVIGGTPIGTWGEVTEVAWWDLRTCEHGRFVPRHNARHVRSHGDITSLTLSRYLERLAAAEQDDGTEVAALHDRLTGATLAGATPSFDARFLRHLFARTNETGCRPREPWHHRLLDLSAYAAGMWRVDGGDLPGLAAVCERLGVDPPDHTAAGDVVAAAECFYRFGAVDRPRPGGAR